MLINSNTIKGRCPVCGAASCSCGGPSDAVGVDKRVVAVPLGGPLREYSTGRPGQTIQLNDEAARARGLLPPKKAEPEPVKKLPPAPNKKRTPERNK